MEKKDLKPGIFYCRPGSPGGAHLDVFMFKETLNKCYKVERGDYSTNYSIIYPETSRLATPEEKHWLEECIKKDTFVPREIAMASFTKTVDVLPAHNHKWAVRRTEENHMILNNWANSQGGYGHSSRDGWIHSINYGSTGHTGRGHYFADDTKHPDHTEITTEQFKRDIMRITEHGIPVTNTFPKQWYMLVDQENIRDAEIWRWDGNGNDYRLEIGQLIGIPDHGYKSHNPGGSTYNFGTKITYDEFRKNVLTRQERAKLITTTFPAGSCIVVTQGNHGYNGTVNYCYRITDHAGLDNTDISLKYQSCNSIGLRQIRVRKAKDTEITRYQREGKPYDITSLDTFIHAPPNTEINPYAGKSLEEMLVICKKMFPKGCKYRKKGEAPILILDEELTIQSVGFLANGEKGISNIGLPWFFFNGTMRVEPVEAPAKEFAMRSDGFIPVDTPKSWSHTKPSKDASNEEILAYCRKMYPIGTIIFDTTRKYQYGITEELFWSADCFISHNGIPIVYDRNSHYFAPIAGYTSMEESSGSVSTKTLDDLPKKAKMSDVSALVKHQEPVIVNSKKAKRSKLIIINK